VQKLLTVNKAAVQVQKSKLHSLMNLATKVTAKNTYAAIRVAENQLHEAKGMYAVLSNLDLLDDISVAKEDLDRIDSKIADILAEKRRSDMIRKH
jgi:hypothetical protein